MSYPVSGAEISPDGTYRYRLWRLWSDRPAVVFIMLNPSTADAKKDDPTIRRCMGFARELGYGGICVVNLYGYRATSPADLWDAEHAEDIVGPQNDASIIHATDVPPRGPVVCAWGAGGGGRTRAGEVYDLLRAEGVQPKCLGLTKYSQPRHPLYLARNTPLQPFYGLCLTRPEEVTP